MRTYERNSPQAAARVVALAALADGHLSKAELDALAASDAEAQLGLKPGEWHDIVDAFCEDLMSNTHQTLGGTCKIDPRALSAVMAEVDDEELRRKVLHLCLSVVDADAEIADEEMIVLRAAAKQWGPLDTPARQAARRMSAARAHEKTASQDSSLQSRQHIDY